MDFRLKKGSITLALAVTLTGLKGAFH